MNRYLTGHSSTCAALTAPILVLSIGCAMSGSPSTSPGAGRDWRVYLGGHRQHALLDAQPDPQGQRGEAPGGLDLRDGRQGRVPDQQPDHRRRALLRVPLTQRHRAERGDRERALEVRPQERAPGHRRQQATRRWSTGQDGERSADLHVRGHVALRAGRAHRPAGPHASERTARSTSGRGWASTTTRRRASGSTRPA